MLGRPMLESTRFAVGYSICSTFRLYSVTFNTANENLKKKPSRPRNSPRIPENPTHAIPF
jgi:hypothetical protein